MNYNSHDPCLIIALSCSSSLITALSHFPIIIDYGLYARRYFR